MNQPTESVTRLPRPTPSSAPVLSASLCEDAFCAESLLGRLNKETRLIQYPRFRINGSALTIVVDGGTMLMDATVDADADGGNKV